MQVKTSPSISLSLSQRTFAGGVSFFVYICWLLVAAAWCCQNFLPNLPPPGCNRRRGSFRLVSSDQPGRCLIMLSNGYISLGNFVHKARGATHLLRLQFDEPTIYRLHHPLQMTIRGDSGALLLLSSRSYRVNSTFFLANLSLM